MGMGQAVADDPRTALQIAYLGVGGWSLLAVPGVYALSRSRLGDPAAGWAALLMASYALVPRISTRALIEVVCVVPLVWGLVLLDASCVGRARRRFAMALAGGLLFGFAVTLRFQLGIVALAMVVWLVIQAGRDRDASLVTRLAPLFGFCAAGMVVLLAEGGRDMASGRPFLDTLIRYLRFNLQHSSKFGTSAWYTYLLQLVAYTIPPATLMLARPLWRAARAHALLSLCLLVFVLAHTLVPHKEDRFLFPILPLLFVLLGAALAQLREAGRWHRLAFGFFVSINVIGLGVATLSDAHRNLTVPLSQIGASGSYQVAVVGTHQVPHYYLGVRSRARGFKTWQDLRTAMGEGHRPDYVLIRPVPEQGARAQLSSLGLACTAAGTFPGDLVDRALVFLNPRHNKRRQPTGLFDCRPEQQVRAQPITSLSSLLAVSP
jgi:hypothetical protein